MIDVTSQVNLTGPADQVVAAPHRPMREDRSSFRICLISLYNRIALGLRVLSALLKREGYHVEVVFLHSHLSYQYRPMYRPMTPAEHDLLGELCRELRPDLIGISILPHAFHPLAREITTTIQEAVDAPILWGGPDVTIMPERCIEHADYLCVGEGENTIVTLAESLRLGNREALQDIPGLVYHLDGETRWNEGRAPVEDLDSLPYPDFDEAGKYLVEGDRILNLEPMMTQSMYPIIASRGCPFDCSYCSRSVIRDASGLTMAVRLHSPEYVVGELEAARQKCSNMRSVRFWDDIFPARLSWIQEFTQLYRERVGLPFGVYMHPKTVNEKAVRLLKEAGLTSVVMGIQSGSWHIRHDLFNRPESQEEIIAASDALAASKIHQVKFDILVGNEYEQDTDKWETLELLLRLKRPFELRIIGLRYLPKTALTERAIQDGTLTEGELEAVFEGDVDAMPHLSPWRRPRPDLDKEEARSLLWTRLYYLTQWAFVPRLLIRQLARWANRNELVTRATIRVVDRMWEIGTRQPMLEYRGLTQSVRKSRRLDPFLRAHPGVRFLGRMVLMTVHRIRRTLRRFKP